MKKMFLALAMAIIVTPNLLSQAYDTEQWSEGQASGSARWFNNEWKKLEWVAPDGHHYRDRFVGVGPYDMDGTKVDHDGIYIGSIHQGRGPERTSVKVTGWRDNRTKTTPQSVTMLPGETRRIVVVTPVKGTYQDVRGVIKPDGQHVYEIYTVDVDNNSDGLDVLPVFDATFISCVFPDPNHLQVTGVEKVSSPLIDDFFCTATIDRVRYTWHLVIRIKDGVTIPDGEMYQYKVKLRYTNGYGTVNSEVMVNVVPYVLNVNLVIGNGANPAVGAGGYATLSGNYEGQNEKSITVSDTKNERSFSLPIKSENGLIALSAGADGNVYAFSLWSSATQNGFASTSPQIVTSLKELSGGGMTSKTLTVYGSFNVLMDENTALFTSTSSGPGVASPKSKSVPIGDSVTFTCIEKGGDLTNASYKTDDGEEINLDFKQMETGLYYDMFAFNIPINGNVKATATFKERPKLNDNDFEDAKDTVSGGGSPSNMPLPSLLKDDQLSELYKLMLDKSKLEPGTWDYALDLYGDEIKDRVGDLNDLINNDEIPDDVKEDLINYRDTTFPKIGNETTTSTGTTTTSTGTTTTSTGTTTTSTGTTTTISGTDTAEEPKPSDPTIGAAAAGGLLFLNQEKNLYKPHWTTERPETPLDKMMREKK